MKKDMKELLKYFRFLMEEGMRELLEEEVPPEEKSQEAPLEGKEPLERTTRVFSLFSEI
jgi:hypothetical protein